MPLVLHGRVMPASNATFVGDLDGLRVVYKPVAGEAPLWDFPDATLATREVASHAVSAALGWHLVPRTWLGEGPHGPGMLQEWCEPDEHTTAVDVVAPDRVPPGWLAVFDGVDAHDRPVTLVHEDSATLRRMAVFDVLVNNADRKGGHVLAMPDGRRLGVDHGLTFHTEHKLRTVLWGWAGQPLSPEERSAVAALDDSLTRTLAALLGEEEVEAFLRRRALLLETDRLPLPRHGRPVIPWPPF